MEIAGQRLDGALYVAIGGGMAVVLKEARVSRPLALSVVDSMGPWTPTDNSWPARRAVEARLRVARHATVESFLPPMTVDLDDAPGHPFRTPVPPETVMARDIKQAERDAADTSDFAGPGRTYPILKEADIAAAAHLIGKAANPDKVKARIIAIAKRKGWTSSLPDAWKTENQ